MTMSRRGLLEAGLLASFMSSMLGVPGIEAAEITQPASNPEEAPHDAYDYWGGFFDGVDTSGSGPKKSRAADAVADPERTTQYLQYHTDSNLLRYATDIDKSELLDYDGDVLVNFQLSQFRPGTADRNVQASQLRVDAVQTKAYMNVLAPLAWTAIASLAPDKAGKMPSLDQLGFKSDQSSSTTGKVLLPKGTGKVAVNVSKAPSNSKFLSAINLIAKGAQMGAPLLSFPAVSVPAIKTFTEVLSYWEDRTRFIMNGNLMSAVATQQAYADPDREDSYISLVSGDYVMVPKVHTEELSAAMPNLILQQGYLVNKNADKTLPLEARSQTSIPDVTYASMKVSVTKLDSSVTGEKPKTDTTDDSSGGDTTSSKSKAKSKK
jgi:hypothetical protein